MLELAIEKFNTKGPSTRVTEAGCPQLLRRKAERYMSDLD